MKDSPNACLAVEALAFASAARAWLDHLLGGDVDIVEGVDAAQLLLRCAHRFATAA